MDTGSFYGFGDKKKVKEPKQTIAPILKISLLHVYAIAELWDFVHELWPFTNKVL
jgi:hypothetical protein